MPSSLAGLSAPTLAALLTVFFVALTLLNVAIGFAAERSLPARKIFDVPLAKGQLRHELLGNGVFVIVCVVAFTLALSSGAMHFASSWVRDLATFALMLVGFQVFYYFLHRAMHLRPLLWMHRWHHQSQVTTPLSAQSVHPVEACAWMIGYIGMPLAISQLVPIGFWGWAAYIAFNVTGNIIGHANVEPTARPAATRTAALFANPFVFHALHHARWTGHYCFQAASMDRLFGTEYDDWPALYDRIAAGRPLKTLKERG